jgi:NTP pyrophosphatase (non-canonical NTP hydrolase)
MNSEIPPQAHDAVPSPSTIEYREAVAAFGEVMVAMLEKNAHKGRRIAWQHWRPDCMAGRIAEELRELAQAIESANAVEAMRESADVANFALMVWDWYQCRHRQSNAEDQTRREKNNMGNNIQEKPTAARCPRCNGVGYHVRVRNFDATDADEWECQSPLCPNYGHLWQTPREREDECGKLRCALDRAHQVLYPDRFPPPNAKLSNPGDQ